MENLARQHHSQTTSSAVQQSGSFISPFEPVAVQRELGTYGRFLDLTPGLFSPPHPEFMVRLLTDAVSHQAYLRDALGGQFKNFENHVRGKHKVSEITIKSIGNVAGWDGDFLKSLGGTSPDGPLLADLLSLFQAIEAFPTSMALGMHRTEIRCKCCGHNIVDDVAHWWAKNGAGIRPSESIFAERLLKALVAVSSMCYLPIFTSISGVDHVTELLEISDPKRHAIGNWLSMVQKSASAKSLVELHKFIFRESAPPDPEIAYSRLKKWASGQDVMPFEAAERVARAGRLGDGWRLRLVKARSVAAIVDFVEASLPDSVDDLRMLARQIVVERIKKIDLNFRTIARQHYLNSK